VPFTAEDACRADSWLGLPAVCVGYLGRSSSALCLDVQRSGLFALASGSDSKRW